jgi:hypothetical protein
MVHVPLKSGREIVGGDRRGGRERHTAFVIKTFEVKVCTEFSNTCQPKERKIDPGSSGPLVSLPSHYRDGSRGVYIRIIYKDKSDDQGRSEYCRV